MGKQSRAPTRDEILKSVFSHDLAAFPELVFCGYGEPTYRLDDATFVAREVKKKIPSIKIRINTNGQSDLIHGRDTAADYEGVFDTVSISLNSPTAIGYQKICHSVYGEEAFDSLVKFAGNVKKYVSCVQLSAVKESLNFEEIELCKKISEELGVTLRLRDYIPPES